MMLCYRHDILCSSFGEQLCHLGRIKVLRSPFVDQLVVTCISIVLFVVLGGLRVWVSDRVEVPFRIWVAFMPEVSNMVIRLDSHYVLGNPSKLSRSLCESRNRVWSIVSDDQALDSPPVNEDPKLGVLIPLGRRSICPVLVVWSSRSCPHMCHLGEDVQW